MSNVVELFTPGSQYRTNGAKSLSFTVPAHSTAIIGTTIEYVAAPGGTPIGSLGDMILTPVTGESWQIVSAKAKSGGDGLGVWTWYFRNTTSSDMNNVQVTVEPPAGIDYNPMFAWSGMAIVSGLDGIPTIAKVPASDLYTGSSAGTLLSTDINAASGGRAVVFAYRNQSQIGAARSGSSLLGTGVSTGNNFSLAMYYRSTDESSAGTVNVGSSETAPQTILLALSFPDPQAGGQTSTTGGFLSALSRMGLGVTEPQVVVPPVVGIPPAVTHGLQLTPAIVGPWALQGVTKGQEVLDTSLVAPSRGYWRWDDPSDNLFPSNPWPTNANDTHPEVLNDPSLLGGVLQSSQVIDGFTYPAGTIVIQYKDMPDNTQHYGQGTSRKVVFRGCRFRWSEGVDGSSITSVAYSTNDFQVGFHYCDIGMQTVDPVAGEGLMHINVGCGRNHRVIRNYHTRSATFLQFNNAPGTEILENYIDEYIYPYGTAGPSGQFGSDAGHLNGFSSEGGQTDIKINRNRIIANSIDTATGSTGYAKGDIGYGTRPTEPDGTATVGYGSGSLGSGRIISQTDNIALFRNFGDNLGGAPGSIQVCDNYLGGTGYCIYAAGPAVNGFTMTGNRFTTLYYTNSGSYGPVADAPTWGQNGNYQADNCYADDYGNGGDGLTAPSGRQYPSGNGPRKNASVI